MIRRFGPVLLLTAAIAMPAVELLGQRIETSRPRYPFVNYDVLSLLLTGRQVAEGHGKLYRDSWDSNFPAIHVLDIALNRITGGDPVGTVRLFHAFMLSLAWLGGLAILGGFRGPRPFAWPALLAIYLFGVVCPIVPNRMDVGQREHLFALVLIPWLLARLRVTAPPPGWLRIGLAFALGWLGTIKPTFIAIPLVVELVRRRDGDASGGREAGAIVAGMIAPLLAVLWVDPGALIVFVRDVLPVHFTPWYRIGFGIPWGDLLRRSRSLVAIGAAIALGVLLVRRSRRRIIPADEARGWAAAALAAAAGVIVQGTGFSYHFIPLHAVLLTGVIATGARAFGVRVATATACLALAVGWMSFADIVRGTRFELTPMTRLVPPRSTVLIFTTDVIFSYDAWFQRWTFPGAWGARVLLVGQIHDPDRARGEAGLAQDRQRTLEALRTRPEFLLVRYNEVRGRGSLEDALIRDLRILPAPGYRRLPDAEVDRRAAPNQGWVVYVRQRVR